MRYKLNPEVKLEIIPAENVVPIKPVPEFRTNTAHIKVVQGGFMDDTNRWHKAPNKVKDAMRIGGWWYWISGVRNNRGVMVIDRGLLVPCL